MFLRRQIPRLRDQSHERYTGRWGAIYGARDAGRVFWEHMVDTIWVNGKWVQNKLER